MEKKLLIEELTEYEIKKAVKDLYSCFSDGKSFEMFLKIYLDGIGFDEIEITQQSRDGGVDLKAVKKGIDMFSDLDSVRYYIQAKRYHPDSSVNIKDIRALRGILTDGVKGIFITNGRFTPKQMEEEKKDKLRPIILIDGKKLIQSCIDFGIGFNYKAVFSQDSIKTMLHQEYPDHFKEVEARTSTVALLQKQISLNDIRAKILPIPSSIYEKLPQNSESYQVQFHDGEIKSLKINHERRFFGGITNIYKKYGLIADNNTYISKTSLWSIDLSSQIISVNFE